MEISGKVHQLGDTQTVGSAGTFKKRTIVIATNEQYVQYVPIDFVQDKCDILNSYNIGDNVKVSINIKGNEYQGKYFCSLQGWRIEKIATEAPAAAPVPVAPVANSNEDEPDDLPF